MSQKSHRKGARDAKEHKQKKAPRPAQAEIGFKLERGVEGSEPAR